MRSERSRKADKSRPQRPTKSRLCVEKLEDRDLMAGNVTAAVQNGLLVITGDTADNSITLNWVQATNTFQVLSAQANNANTTVNGVDSTAAAPQAFTGVTKGIKITMNAGNDTVVVGGTNTTFSVAGYMAFDMGAGNDTVTMGRNETVANNVTTPESEVSIGASVEIKMAGGNDTVNITNTHITRDLVIHADVNNPVALGADGQDTVAFPTTFTPQGGTPVVFPVTVGGKATILLGGNVDTLTIANFSAGKGLLVGDLAGNLTMNATDSHVGGEFKLQKNGGAANTVNIKNVTGGTLRLNTGNGVDTLTIRDSIFQRLYIDTAASADLITIGNTTVSKGGIIDGARNKARLTQEAGNHLKAVAKIRTFTV